MKNLYIDFDGVIMDTIRTSTELMEKLEINKEDSVQVDNFYANLNWDNLSEITPILNDAFKCIDKLLNSNKFNVSILTHVNSLNEAVAKVDFIRNHTGEVTVIPVPIKIAKTKMCKALDAILVDDYSVNLRDWEANGGIGIQFSLDLSKDKGFTVIDRLDKLIDMF